MRRILTVVRQSVGKLVWFREAHPLLFFITFPFAFFLTAMPVGLLILAVETVSQLGFLVGLLYLPLMPILFCWMTMACEQMWSLFGIYRLLKVSGFPLLEEARVFANK